MIFFENFEARRWPLGIFSEKKLVLNWRERSSLWRWQQFGANVGTRTPKDAAAYWLFWCATTMKNVSPKLA